jgi:hypothetical protein
MIAMSDLVINARHCPTCDACWHAGQTCSCPRPRPVPNPDCCRNADALCASRQALADADVLPDPEPPVPAARTSGGAPGPVANTPPADDGILDIPVLSFGPPPPTREEQRGARVRDKYLALNRQVDADLANRPDLAFPE